MSIAKNSRQPSDLDKTIMAVKVLIDEFEALQQRVERLEDYLGEHNRISDISELSGEVPGIRKLNNEMEKRATGE